ncbi:unnamed protein product [Phyllotreta striolata]|uniref:RanBD1 domain-containing protein n=1 Tax=Phyllotreta striolata TaxID=444603 RepID=A0A9N9XLY2_PHYSR|nr:unnamed protein product [Phyllotreta striolata]
MFKTKLEVDKHVNNCLKKITNDTERNLRCFSFAKLYYNVGDYEHAYRYATSYLSVKSKSAEGHLLLGKSLEKLGKYEAALEAYRNSLQADPKQNNLVLKVCELLSSDNIDMDLSGARYFCELAQSIAPDNPSVFALKEKLICIEHENPTEVARLLLEELERRPTDVSLRTRLLRHFVRHNMITEAYKHASSIEDSAAHAPDSGQSRCDFFNNLMWYETFYEVLSKYRKARSSEINEAFWLKFVSVCERVADLSLQEYRLGEGTKTKGVPEYVQTVLNLDETLNEAYRFVNSTSSDRSATKVFFEQYRAQLYFHLATLVYKQAKRDILDFKEASNVVLPLLFVAYHTNPPESNNRLYKLACYRNSQTGHILLSLSKDGKSLLLEKAAQYSTGTWRENLYKKLFGRRDLTASFFLNQLLTEPVNKLPIIDDLLTYDTVALKLYPDSLHHYVWVMMNDNVPVNIRLVPFDGLLYSTANLSNCAAESLNYLDVYSFVCCATFCSTIGHSNRRLLPANITDNLVTVEQSKFMLGAYKMYQNDRSTDTGDLRMLLIKGIEVTRCIGQHGLDAKLLVSLGELLEERAKKLDKRSEVELTLDRAELYWSTGLSLLDRIVNEEAVVHSNNRLFAYKSDLTSQEARSMINKGKLFLAVRTFEKNRLEQALAMLKELKDPYASYHQYEIYKKMSDANANANTKTSLLTLARDSLYLTLDRLREQPYTYSHPLNLELGTKITEIEQQLDLTGVYDRELDLNMTGLSLSNDAYSTPARPSNKQASLREECRPSPERLDAQIRQLACSKDASFTIVSEQNRMVVDMQKCLLDKLNRVIDELKDIKGDVEALKERAKTEAGAAGVHADDIQNMMDVIQEIRKDLNEVKKNDSRNNQLSDEDLYVLDPDYGVDYNLSGNMAGTSMYGNFPTPRMPNPNHLAAYGQSLMYPGLYPGGLTYPYGGLNFVQPGPLPFLPDHQQPPLSTSAAAAAAPSNLLSQPIGLNQTKFLPTADVATSSRINQIAAPPALSLPAPASVATPTTTPSAPARPNPTTPLFGKGAPVNVVITTSDPLPNRSALTAQQPVLSVTIPPQHVKSNSGKAAAAATPSKGDGGTADGAESAADGEENEEVVFCKRAKLFNYVTVDGKKEWKERGTGELKVLRNKSTGKSRILMRRERTRKICANHFVRDDTHLVRPNNSDLSFIWLAHDYSDGTAAAAAAPPRPETFHVKFAAADEATAFYDAVESVKSSTGKSGTRPVDSTKTSAKDDAESATTSTTVSSTSKSSMGGFVFTGTPTFKPKELGSEAPTTAGVADVEPAGTKTGTPFVSFVFGKAVDEPKKTFAPLVIARENDDDGGDKEDKVEEFVPTAEFKPVVPLPDIVEVKTGEEGAEVLFEARTKLFRYVTNEWKERGLGCLKVLKDNDSIRLLMRRDQVHKICCNHRVLKDMPFKLKSDNPKAVMWSAQDFSEEELKLETFTARFRSEEIAAEFIRILSDNQLKLDENNSFGTTPAKNRTDRFDRRQRICHYGSDRYYYYCYYHRCGTESGTIVFGGIRRFVQTETRLVGVRGLFGTQRQFERYLYGLRDAQRRRNKRQQIRLGYDQNRLQMELRRTGPNRRRRDPVRYYRPLGK